MSKIGESHLDKFCEMEKALSIKEKYFRRRDVVHSILSGGHVDAVAKEFGVSRASAYNWMRDYNENGAKQLIHADGDKRFAMPGLTPFTTLNFIRHVVVRNPDMSADRLSEHLGTMGRDVSPRTLRNMFSEMGISSASARRSQAFDWRHGQLAEKEFSDDELTQILSGPDGLQPGELKGRRPGDVMVQDRIKFPKGFCDQSLALELIVDTFAPMKRIYVSLASPSDQLSRDALSKVLATYKDDGFNIHKVCTPRKHQYSGELGAIAYPKWFNENPAQVLEVRQANSKTADSRIKVAWSFVKLGWLKTMQTRLPAADRSQNQIEIDLQGWLDA